MGTPARLTRHVLADDFRLMMDDLQFLAGRPEEWAYIEDKLREIHHRRMWVEEREQYERDRQSK